MKKIRMVLEIKKHIINKASSKIKLTSEVGAAVLTVVLISLTGESVSAGIESTTSPVGVVGEGVVALGVGELVRVPGVATSSQ